LEDHSLGYRVSSLSAFYVYNCSFLLLFFVSLLTRLLLDFLMLASLLRRYHTYSWDPFSDNKNLTQAEAVMDWLENVVQIGNESDTRGLIFLTHHQVRTAFHGEGTFLETPHQVANLMPPNRTVVWLWGHEHRVSWYDMFSLDNSTVPLNVYGRCVGNSGFPGEMAPIPPDAGATGLRAYDDRLYTYESGFSNASVSYNGFVRIKLQKNVATILYSSLEDDPTTGRLSPTLESPLVTESFSVDMNTGNVEQIDFEVLNPDITIVSPGKKQDE
jgi:hypothetical protein